MTNYVKTSLETHLFFGRIMKEHSLFLMAGFPAAESSYINEANWYRDMFENALREAVRLANGNVGEDVLQSGEVVTEYTETAERQTSRLSGVPIDTRITRAEQRLRAGGMEQPSRELEEQVRALNQRVIQLTSGLIRFKERVLKDVLSCNLYTANYPLLIEHIIREARLYLQTIRDLETGRVSSADSRNTELFWNQIMMEHAEFIRGLLDPTEEALMETADELAEDFRELLEQARRQDMRASNELTRRTIEKTEEIRDFKAAGTRGLTRCEIRSIILPLLADHVLREANHYLRVLEEID
ncbi:MAG: DUF2935 domain-containing protein [Agathobacter sp.]|nr:DUF2935 domain-containing protein [Agathobacter sp.]